MFHCGRKQRGYIPRSHIIQLHRYLDQSVRVLQRVRVQIPAQVRLLEKPSERQIRHLRNKVRVHNFIPEQRVQLEEEGEAAGEAAGVEVEGQKEHVLALAPALGSQGEGVVVEVVAEGAKIENMI